MQSRFAAKSVCVRRATGMKNFGVLTVLLFLLLLLLVFDLAFVPMKATPTRMMKTSTNVSHARRSDETNSRLGRYGYHAKDDQERASRELPVNNPDNDERRRVDAARGYLRGEQRVVARVIKGPSGCEERALLVIVVCSAPDHFRHRDVIRRTWAASGSASVLFLVGRASDGPTNGRIAAEYATWRDVLLVNVADTRHRLTAKSLAMLQWLGERCPDVGYLLKVDDDTAVNVAELTRALRHIGHRRFIMGEIIAGASPVRNRASKWYTPRSLYPAATYPDYVSGSAYVVSGDLIAGLRLASRTLAPFWLEDVFLTGMCRQRLGAILVHNSRFKSFGRFPFDACVLSQFLVVHRIEPDQLSELWRENENRTAKCK